MIQMKTNMTLFEDYQIRRIYDEASEIWWFSVIDIVQVLTQQSDYQTARKYWNKLKQRLGKEGSQLVTNCHQLKITVTDRKQQLEKESSQSVTNCNQLKLTAADGENIFEKTNP